MKPAISVCVPTYNGAKYLRECLDSVLAQTFGDFEVILLDDQSSDGSLDLMQEYASHDSRVRLLRNPQNLGMTGNWNRCLELAEGEWIKFVFQDDKIDSRCLESLLKVSRPDVPLTVCRRRFFYENVSQEEQSQFENYLIEQCLPAFFPEGGFLSPSRFCVAALERPGVNFVGEPSAVMVHRSVAARFGGFNPFFLQLSDFEYWARVACHGGLIFVPEALASFRVHPDSKTSVNKAMREFRCEIIDPLLLKYEFAYAPHYAPMREMARKLGINLKRSLAANARRAETIARRWAKDVLVPDDMPITEWRSILSTYPNLVDSPYAWANKFNDDLDRRVLWRFRKTGVRFKNPNTRCPIIICMDVEPDDVSMGRDQAATWSGFELAGELFATVRSLLASVTGAPVRYTWMLRMDPQVADRDDTRDGLVQHYAARIQKYISESDEIGIHTDAPHWDSAGGQRVADSQQIDAWVKHCVATSFKSFRAVLGRDCYSFRFGGGWMSNWAIMLLEELGVRFDLSLQRGLPRAGPASPGYHLNGSLSDTSLLTLMPYRPALHDFSSPDPARREGLWIIPLSAGIENATPLTPGETSRYKAVNLESPPHEFEWLTNTILTSLERPYLALRVSSSMGVNPRLLRNLKMNFSSLLMHPLADRFVICTPAEALGMLGY